MDPASHYMHWAKVHDRVRYELTGSGISTIPPTELGLAAVDRLAGGDACECEGAYGHPPLIDAIAERYVVHPDQVVPVPGASGANFIALAAAARRGEIVAFEHPLYQPVELAARFLGQACTRIERRGEAGFLVEPADVASALAAGAKAVYLTNLHNPSGQLLPREHIAELARLCDAAEATLIVDEVYLDANCFLAGGPLWTAAHCGERVIALNSLTKDYGLSGYRLGWLIAPPSLAWRAREIMDLLSVNNAAPSMVLATAAFGKMDILEARYRRYHEGNSAILQRWLGGEPRVKGYPDHGALFACIRLPEGMDGKVFNQHLVSTQDTQVTPGEYFELAGHVRIGLATEGEELAEGLRRISAALDTMGKVNPRG